ncbi:MULTISPECIES: hypothetical protein [Cytobacillus]|uniref:Endolytic transglycosylase MltG n=1 Tax=Cytobacillus stercorigallinarum TaxID=2762240 RepID=A0ABR8QT54_9BACI|nr:hypothetical protein [Cytobacillus stercorigallinarum]MBD7938607.1 hypothetical protein [Cytobacillus stercorigallinarum]
MSEKTMRSFAGGLIVAAVILGITYFLSPSDSKQTEAAEPKATEEVDQPAEANKEELSTEEMEEALQSQGFIIHSEKEWNNINKDMKDIASVKEENEKLKKQLNDAKANENEKAVYRTMLTVTSGMTSIDVGDALESAKIIKNGKDFFDTVEKKGLENDLRPGTFEVNSDMSMNDLVNTVFKK